jgi:para-aminobenzoate synthetase/4-amino-4-deoxychorismate lyase
LTGSLDSRLCALIDFAEAGEQRRTLMYADPLAIFEARSPGDVVHVLERVEDATRDGLHAVGFVSYEATPGIDASMRMSARTSHPELPLAWFAITREPEPIDLDALELEPFVLGAMQPSCTRETYERGIADVLEQIARGDLYQLNYTFRLRGTCTGDPLDGYRRLRDAQASGACARYAAYLNLRRHRIVSASPELFFRQRGRTIETRPMKGTSKRGRWLEEDDTLAARLVASPKERAENAMITDLLRNDLGRVAEFGTVQVAALFTVERYPTVLQLTSTVSASVREETTLATTFRALFPPGSVTGAPKRAAVESIDALEGDARGVYCGAIGVVAPGGDATFNVAIRTLTVDTVTGIAEYGVGGGITADSSAEREYDEAMLKARILTSVPERFQLIETLRLEHGVAVRGEQHVARMRASARYFGFADPAARAREAIAALARTHPAGTFRVRLLASPDGTVVAESHPLDEPYLPFGREEAGVAPPLRNVALAPRAVSHDDVLLHHKTTSRAIFETFRREQPQVWDTLLWNTRGEVTELTIGNLVYEWGGELCTPPRECGLLAGVLRDEELTRGRIRERRLLVEELPRAGAMWRINSLRGWQPVRLVR